MRTLVSLLLSAPWLLLGPSPTLAQDEYPNLPPADSAASAPAAALPDNHTRGVEETAASCHARWEEYRASLECFAPYRHSEHVIDIEAYKHCKVVKEPTDCEEYK